MNTAVTQRKRADAVYGDGFQAISIDWNAVDREKAELIYSEAKQAKRDIIDTLNTLNSKAFQVLTLTLSLVTVTASAIAAGWHQLVPALQAGGLCFLGALITACLSSIASLWPRTVYNPTLEPQAYFSHDYYKKSFLTIIKGNILGAIEDIAVNRDSERKRGAWLKISFISLGAAIPASLAAFILILLLY